MQLAVAFVMLGACTFLRYVLPWCRRKWRWWDKPRPLSLWCVVGVVWSACCWLRCISHATAVWGESCHLWSHSAVWLWLRVAAPVGCRLLGDPFLSQLLSFDSPLAVTRSSLAISDFRVWAGHGCVWWWPSTVGLAGWPSFALAGGGFVAVIGLGLGLELVFDWYVHSYQPIFGFIVGLLALRSASS